MQEGRREMWWLSIMGVLVVLVWIVGGEGVSAAGRVSNLEPERYRVVDLTVGTNAYVDRNYELEGVPAGFAGGVLIRTANDDKQTTSSPQVTFDVRAPVNVGVLFDERVSPIPNWLTGWTRTESTVRVTGPDRALLRLYTRQYGAGRVELGGNIAGLGATYGNEDQISQYVVIVVESDEPVPTGTAEPDGDVTITEVSGNGGEYAVSRIDVGERVYTDRSYVWTSVPTEFMGQPVIRTPNSAKGRTEQDTVTLELNGEGILAVAFDERITPMPGWLAGWTRTSVLLQTSDPFAGTRRVYARDVTAGRITLGGNKAPPAQVRSAASMYSVILLPPGTELESGEPGPTTTPVPTATAGKPTATPVPTATAGKLDKTGTQWAFLEWSLENPSSSGNPFDLVATATFVHQNSGETRTTEMFYDGGDTWKFRFTGTQAGTWTVTTSSSNADLDGHRGTVEISASDLPGFVTAQNGQWVRSGTGQAFVPRYVIQDVPAGLSSSEIASDIQTFVQDAGFTGFHSSMGCSWFDKNTKECDSVGDTNPDRDTFALIEELITETYDAGGAVHLWMWGDSSRDQNPTQGMDGLDGTAARRVQRYIAARLGPLPGWTMGYGYDVWEWADSGDVKRWHNYMEAHLGWEHLLGARYKAEQIGIWTDVLEYASYEQVKPGYDELRQAFDHKATKPAFSEDRWRNLDSGSRDFSEDELRRVAWNAVMSGGVAGIYGNLTGGQGSDDGSKAFANADQFRTLARFWEGRYTLGVARCNDRTDAVCLQSGGDYIFYGEDVSVIQIEGLSGKRGVAVDTHTGYQEISVTLDGNTWTAPYRSDWAIAIEP